MKKLVERFFNNEFSGSILLIVAMICAIVMVNFSKTEGLYHAFLSLPIEVRIGALKISKNMLMWINDALMAVFFLLIGLEVKRELVQGALAGRQFAIFPAVAAFGGMVVPALIYLAFNYRDPIVRTGWAIPTTTDVAFTLSVLSLLGKGVPAVLRIFLMALATIDDLSAIVIIALFYSSEVSILSLSVAAISTLALASLNIYDVRRISSYIFVGIILWIALLRSGVHATLAGVILGFFIPLKRETNTSSARELELLLRPWVVFVILPLFAFANAGVSLQGITPLNGLTLMLPIGIVAGLFIGKPLGISLFCWLALKFKLSCLPRGASLRQIMAVSVLCGIGFTMAIFIANLAFASIDPHLILWAKVGILVASLLAAFFGSILLKIQVSKR